MPNKIRKENVLAYLIYNRGLTEENTQLGIISPIGYFKSPTGYFKSPIGDTLSNWGLVIFSHRSPIPNWIYYPQL